MFVCPNVTRPNNQYWHCHHCLRTTRCLLPCPRCPDVMFCSSECLNEARATYHKFECECGILAFCSNTKAEDIVREIAFPLRILFSFSVKELEASLIRRKR